jgi:alanyl-tRNA synthetase
MTERLYLSDSYLTRFRARVVRTLQFKGRLAVILNQTAFYPEGGGQPGDRGVLGTVPVRDTQELDGEVLHLVDEPTWTAEEVDGAVDWLRRFDHIQQHHGQHLLSAAFQRVHGAATVSFHLGEKTCTIDLDCSIDKLTTAALRAAESAANESVWQDHPVIARDFIGEERARLTLRKEAVKGDRVILVEGIDASPCGGTHPRRTGEVGCIAIIRAQRWGSGAARVEFICGNRVVRAFGQATESIARAAEALRVAPGELAEGAARLAAEAQARRKAVEALEEKLAAQKAEQLIAAHPGGAIAETVEGGMQATKLLAAALVARRRIALIASPDGERVHLSFARPAGTGVPMNAVLKSVLPILEGRGGGSAENAQGSGNASRLTEALSAALKQVNESERDFVTAGTLDQRRG